MSLDLVRQAEPLMAAGRWTEAVALIEPVVETAGSAVLWSMLGVARLRIGRRDQAADALLRAAALDAEGGRAWLNAAALLVEGGRVIQARQAVEKALAAGFAPPEAHLIHGRALKGTGDFAEAEAAFAAAILDRPAFAEAHRELAQLVWMRTGDAGLAAVALDRAIAVHPGDPALRAERTRLLTAAGDEPGARAEAARLVAALRPGPGRRLFEAHEANLRGDYAAAEAAARDAAGQGADALPALEALAAAQLGQGDARGLLETVEAWLGRTPWNQLAIGYRATALRLLGDPAGEAFRDYDRLVRPFNIDTPQGWDTLEGYLADLAASLAALHPFQAAPVDQSARHGSQTMQSLVLSPDPAIQAFFRAIDGPIRRYLEALGPGDDPLRSRNRGRYDIRGCWSVWLKPGGFHVDHVHPQGWISSACYIATPKAVEDAGAKQGWIRFGRPAIQPPGGLEAEHFVKPAPGRLVLFPAWMWHGTVPFTTLERRLTMAFDVLPG